MVSHGVGPKGSSLWEGNRIADGVAKLGRRRAITVKLGTDGDTLGSHWLLKHPNAVEMLPEPTLKSLWYEVMHLDAASYGAVPIIKHPFEDGVTAEEWAQLHDPSGLRKVITMKSTVTDVFVKDLMYSNGWPVCVIGYDRDRVIEHRRDPDGCPEVLIFFKHHKYLKHEDLPFIKRFYGVAFRSRPKVYRVPKDMEEVAITYEAMSSLAA